MSEAPNQNINSGHFKASFLCNSKSTTDQVIILLLMAKQFVKRIVKRNQSLPKFNLLIKFKFLTNPAAEHTHGVFSTMELKLCSESWSNTIAEVPTNVLHLQVSLLSPTVQFIKPAPCGLGLETMLVFIM